MQLLHKLMLTPITILSLASVQAAHGQSYTFKTLASFSGANGQYPVNSLSSDNHGSLYGTTRQGGVNGKGTLFQWNPASGLSTLASFNGSNGSSPTGHIAVDTQGNVYGTTIGGGANGNGALFFYSRANSTLNAPVSFTGLTPPYFNQQPLGTLPNGLVYSARDNTFYGTTFGGGTYGNGTVFGYNLSSGLQTLASIQGSNSGPLAGVVQAVSAGGNGANEGYLYGTTFGNNPASDGTVFQYANTGQLSTIQTFTLSGSTGPGIGDPAGSLTFDTKGNLYGTTTAGGLNNNGSIFEITSKGLTVLASFVGPNGSKPYGAVTIDAQGNLYGTTRSGGTSNAGTIFRYSPVTGLTTLFSFTGGADGSDPYTDLSIDAQGNLYGTTQRGGSSNNGTIFELVAPAPEPSTLVSLLLGAFGLGTLTLRTRWKTNKIRTYAVDLG